MSASAQADYLNAVVEIETGLKCMRCLTGCVLNCRPGASCTAMRPHTGPGFAAVWRAHRLGRLSKVRTAHAPARFCTAPLAEIAPGSGQGWRAPDSVKHQVIERAA
jgi:hypothetical protein